MNKRGLSAVVATVLIIALSVVVVTILWAVVSNLVNQNLEEGEACFGVFDQVTINNDYTCYNSTSKSLQFSILVGDINASGILVSVAYGGSSQSFVLNSTVQDLSNVKNYPGGSSGVKMPDQNAGLTYFFEGVGSEPTSISIVPYVNDKQCDATDTLKKIDNCQALLN